jgi:hypothetical protein
LLALLLAATAAADRPLRAGRVPAGIAAARQAHSFALPAFTLFGWVSPPLDSTTAGRYAELAGAGFNMTVLAWEDSGRVSDNRKRLDFTRELGVRNLLFDRELEQVVPGDASTYVHMDSVAARYRDDPAFLGYYLGDEPHPNEFGTLQVIFRELRARDAAHPCWNNLLGRSEFPTRDAWLEYTRAYVTLMQPSVLCNDHYEFLKSGDRHQLIENVAGLASVARENGLPFWGIVLLVQHGNYRMVDAGMLRWQVGQWLSYGARGIGYFTYWTPAPNPQYDWQPAMITWGEGARTWRYDFVQRLDQRLRPLGETLARMQWLATEHAGSVEPGGTPFAPDSLIASVQGRCALGLFADSSGAPCVLVANSDSASAQRIVLTFRGVRDASQLDSLGVWRALAPAPVREGVSVSLDLAPGDFTLLRLTHALDALGAGGGPLRLLAAPQPARSALRFEVSGMEGASHLELLDIAGRRVWARRFLTGASVISWDGRDDDGRAVTPGLYFARLEDARAVRVRRVTWLGGAAR